MPATPEDHKSSAAALARVAHGAEVAKKRRTQDGPIQASGYAAMGMLVDSIYSRGWTDEIDHFLGGQ
jgi:hypothetical protein